uniref:hypothetical protein n=1 Tax=Natronobacterium lacisalsi TaxID=229731 RepID=UPI0004978119|nr:hypothetical protein [Halobiforma lacisalsi]
MGAVRRVIDDLFEKRSQFVEPRSSRDDAGGSIPFDEAVFSEGREVNAVQAKKRLVHPRQVSRAGQVFLEKPLVRLDHVPRRVG